MADSSDGGDGHAVPPDEESDRAQSYWSPDDPTWMSDTTLLLVAVTWYDQQDVAMHDQQFALLVDDEDPERYASSNVTGVVSTDSGVLSGSRSQ